MIDAAAEFRPLAIAPEGDNDNPNCTDLVVQYTDRLRSVASGGEISAGALCCDSRFGPENSADKKGAIAVDLNHTERITVFLPYRKRLLLGYKFDEPVTSVGARSFFTAWYHRTVSAGANNTSTASASVTEWK